MSQRTFRFAARQPRGRTGFRIFITIDDERPIAVGVPLGSKLIFTADRFGWEFEVAKVTTDSQGYALKNDKAKGAAAKSSSTTPATSTARAKKTSSKPARKGK